MIPLIEFDAGPMQELLPPELVASDSEGNHIMDKKFSICGTFIIRAPDGNCLKTIHANIKVDSIANLEAALVAIAESAAKKVK